MLERIHRVKGIGLLHDADGRPHTLKKATLVYADNGVGKSTLASIFRSCASNDPELIRRRKTIDGSCQPEVLLQFSNGQQTSFANANWNNSHPELLVFDAEFVEKNVYAGGQVSTDQRKNLLQFALGSSAVNAQREYDQADTDALAATQLVRDLTNKLTGFHQGVTLQQFRDLAEVPDADNQIAALNERVVEAQNIGLIQAKALPKKLDEPAFDVTHIFRIFESSLADIDLAAEQRVKQHLDSHAKPNLERWISDGHSYGETESCPYCDQPLQGVELIQAYRSYFNEDYNELKASVADLARLISNAAPEAIVERLQASFATASATIDGWQEHVEIPPPEFDREAANEKLAVIRERLDALRLTKEANLLESVGPDDAKNELLGIWAEIVGIIKSCNNGIDDAVNLITAYKASLASVNLDDLRQAINGLEMAKTRHRQDVLDLLSQLDAALAQEVATKAEKQTKKDALNAIMQTTLKRYKGRINQLLSAFGAQFSIPNIDFNYRGGVAEQLQPAHARCKY